MYARVVRRKILIVEDEPSIRNALYVLLAGVNCESEVAVSGRQALAMISRESFDAILLDLRCSGLAPQQVLEQIHKLRPALVGRVLVITGELADPQALELIERNCLPHVPRNRLVQDLWVRLRALLGAAPSPNHAP